MCVYNISYNTINIQYHSTYSGRDKEKKGGCKIPAGKTETCKMDHLFYNMKNIFKNTSIQDNWVGWQRLSKAILRITATSYTG